MEKDKKSVSVGVVAESSEPQKSVSVDASPTGSLTGFSIQQHYFLIIFPLRSTTPPLVFQSAVRAVQPSARTTARRASRCLMRQKVLCRVETAACGANHGCEFHSNVLSRSCIPTVVSTAAAESQTSRFPRFSPQSRFKLSTQKACPEKILLPGVSSLKGAHRIPVSAFFFFLSIWLIFSEEGFYSQEILCSTFCRHWLPGNRRRIKFNSFKPMRI